MATTTHELDQNTSIEIESTPNDFFGIARLVSDSDRTQRIKAICAVELVTAEDYGYTSYLLRVDQYGRWDAGQPRWTGPTWYRIRIRWLAGRSYDEMKADRQDVPPQGTVTVEEIDPPKKPRKVRPVETVIARSTAIDVSELSDVIGRG